LKYPKVDEFTQGDGKPNSVSQGKQILAGVFFQLHHVMRIRSLQADRKESSNIRSISQVYNEYIAAVLNDSSIRRENSAVAEGFRANAVTTIGKCTGWVSRGMFPGLKLEQIISPTILRCLMK